MALLGTFSLGAADVSVSSGDDLQAALDAAKPGETILLQPGVTYIGHFILRARADPSDRRPIVVRTAGQDAVAAGERMRPDVSAKLARLKSPDETPVLSTAPGARFWTIQLIEFQANRDGAGDIIVLGDGSAAQSALDGVPSDLVLDRLLIRGDEQKGQKRAIALNSARTTIANSYIADIKSASQDSQAIAGWNGPGPFLIDNNYLEAAGENIMFGGADPFIRDLTPADIVIRRNTIAKPLAWKSQSWQVKNLLELKNARGVTIADNLLERHWAGAQSGYAVLFTPRNQDGRCSWCAVTDVRFESNVVKDISAGFNILGRDNNAPTGQTRNIVIRNNLIDGLDSSRWGGDGYFLQMLDDPRDITVDHNTVIQGQSGGIAKIDGVVEGFTFTNNVIGVGAFGVIATSRAPGLSSIRSSLPGSTFVGNVFAGGDAALYPPGNVFPSLDELRRQFIDIAAGDYRLKAGSSWAASGTGGTVPGADFSSSGEGGRAVPRDGVSVPRTGGRR